MTLPVPDWNKTKVFLVDPTIWKEYQKPHSDLRPVYRELTEALETLEVEYQIFSREDHPVDIWIRDWGFVEGAYFRYDPSYAKNFYSQQSIARARKVLSERSDCTSHHIPLVLDDGNLIHNGKIAILTEKVFWDNSHHSRAEIEQTIISLGFERVVFIPVEPGDTIGHADGILRFISRNVLLVNDYTGTYFADYRRRLFTRLEGSNLNAELVPFPWFTTDKKLNGIWSAEGTYVNFIFTASGIVCPQFNHQSDSSAVDLVIKYSSLPVQTVDATGMARLGGVLNCVVQTI